LTVRDIERLTGVNKDAVSRFEAGRDILASALQKLERFLRDEGVIFLDADANDGVGVRMPAETNRRSSKSKSAKRTQKN
jgi:hypothetical protein